MASLREIAETLWDRTKGNGKEHFLAEAEACLRQAVTEALKEPVSDTQADAAWLAFCGSASTNPYECIREACTAMAAERLSELTEGGR